MDARYALVSKTEGQKVMVSCFCSREFGLGFDLTKEQLKQISDWRNIHFPYYKDIKVQLT